MTRHLLFAAGLASALIALGCASKSTPLAPSTSTTAAAGSLKVSAPSLVSPTGGQQVSTLLPTLTLQRATGVYATPNVSYEIQVNTLGGDVVYTRTVDGGPANGQGTVAHVVATSLSSNTSYRWRARAVIGGDAGPWSNDASGAALFATQLPLGPSSSNDDFKTFFFGLIAQKGVGGNASAQALSTMEPDLNAVGITLEKSSGGEVRGRIYLPSGIPSNPFARAVDIGSFGSPWQWLPRSGTVCEGIC